MDWERYTFGRWIRLTPLLYPEKKETKRKRWTKLVLDTWLRRDQVTNQICLPCSFEELYRSCRSFVELSFEEWSSKRPCSLESQCQDRHVSPGQPLSNSVFLPAGSTYLPILTYFQSLLKMHPSWEAEASPLFALLVPFCCLRMVLVQPWIAVDRQQSQLVA